MSTRVDFSKLSLMDALDLATLIEVEAHKRYVLFAQQLGTGYAGDAASVFQSMAVNESKHGEQLAERRLALFGDERPRVKLDDIFDVEAPDVAAPTRNMSPLDAYLIALSSERKAHDFYDRALRYVTHPEVKALFEELREEESEHVQMLEAIIAK
ncbi:MAG TPA: ferritin family protein, partial [Burkholderiaceae bacterium]|nr:ferritin family protein [Burkholderiaceae bacterium]